MIRFVKVLLFILVFIASGFSKNLQASYLLNHVSEHISHNHHHPNHGDEKKHDHRLEFSLLIQVVNIEEKIEVVQDISSFKEIWSFPFFISQIFLSDYISSLFRPPIS